MDFSAGTSVPWPSVVNEPGQANVVAGMKTVSIRDLGSQWRANRRFWASWADADADADLAIYRSGIAYPLFNGVLRVRDVPIGEAIGIARTTLGDTPWAWWVGGDSAPGVADALIAHGAQPLASMPVMAYNLERLRPRPVPEGLTMMIITRASDLDDFVTAYGEPLGLPPEVVRTLGGYERDRLSRGDQIVHVAGIVGDEIVATAEVSLGDDTAGLYCIATDARYRRRGLATALTHEALRVAREAGHAVATLQASAEGVPVYEAMGFETVAGYDLFAFPPEGR